MRRKTYTPEFRAEAVRLLVTSDKSARDLGEELGVSDCSLLNWKRQALRNGDHPAQAKTKGVRLPYSVLEAENLRLKKGLAIARHEREIQKKSLGILSVDPSQKGMP